jgi:hypothetical protein
MSAVVSIIKNEKNKAPEDSSIWERFRDTYKTMQS